MTIAGCGWDLGCRKLAKIPRRSQEKMERCEQTESTERYEATQRQLGVLKAVWGRRGEMGSRRAARHAAIVEPMEAEVAGAATIAFCQRSDCWSSTRDSTAAGIRDWRTSRLMNWESTAGFGLAMALALEAVTVPSSCCCALAAS